MRSIALQCRYGGKDGWGHLMRCSAIAEEARERGWIALLWTESSGHAIPEGLRHVFSKVLRTEDLEPHSMPFVVQQADVLLIDDMYQQDDYFEEMAKGYRRKGHLLVAMDDLQRRPLGSVDLVINSQLGLKGAGYRARVSLLGERYAALRPGFRRPTLPRDGVRAGSTERRVFIMVGGTDPLGLSATILRRLLRYQQAGKQSWQPVVVTGDLAASVLAALREVLGGFSGGIWRRGLSAEEVAGWMASCAVGVVGCGSTVYEAAAMRLPFVGISFVDNQRLVARQVAETWGMPVLDCEMGVEPLERLPEHLESLMAMEGRRWDPGVDTNGGRRVLEVVERMLAG